MLNRSLPYTTVAIAALLSACQSIQPPELIGFRITEPPARQNKGAVRIPVELQVRNLNKGPIQLMANRVLLVENSSGKPLGVTSFEYPITVLPQVSAEAEPFKTAAVLHIEENTWNPDLYTQLSKGNARLTGTVQVTYDGSTRDIPLNLIIPPSKQKSRVFSLNFGDLKLRFLSLSKIAVETELTIEEDYGQNLVLEDVRFSLGAPNTKSPIVIKADTPLHFTGSTTKFSGQASLEDCDPTLLDDIEANKRNIVVRVLGSARSEQIPKTNFDEQSSMTLPKDNSPSEGTVQLERPHISMFSSVIGYASQNTSILERMSTLSKLASFKPTNVQFAVKNPIPGTVRMISSRVILLGPYNRRKRKRLSITQITSQNEVFKPRSTKDVDAEITLLKEGRNVWRAVALDMAAAKLQNYCFETEWTIYVPVIGRIDSAASRTPVYSDSSEDCSR